MDYNNYSTYPPYDMGNMENQNLNDSFFNPSAQYEQAYMYYRYLEKQMDTTGFSYYVKDVDDLESIDVRYFLDNKIEKIGKSKPVISMRK